MSNRIYLPAKKKNTKVSIKAKIKVTVPYEMDIQDIVGRLKGTCAMNDKSLTEKEILAKLTPHLCREFAKEYLRLIINNELAIDSFCKESDALYTKYVLKSKLMTQKEFDIFN